MRFTISLSLLFALRRPGFVAGSLGIGLALAAPAMAGPIGVTVMTRNLYVGADTSGILSAPDIASIPAATKAAFAQAQGNDFDLRVDRIADEIGASNPHLIGLQEAARLTAVSTTGVTTYDRDFVQILLGELSSRGLDYKVAVTHTGFSTTLPSGASFSELEHLVTLTDREVILRRSDVSITATKEATFVNDATLTLAGGNFKFNRGYVAVDAEVGGVPFRFVSTHLDELLTPLQPLQLGEILAGTGDAQRLILVGDLNSAADGSSTPTYGQALAAGFDDVWATLGVGPGFTHGQRADLANTNSQLSTRIDYILHRGELLDAASIDLVGAAPFGGEAPLYASDHAGLVATFLLDVPEPTTLANLGVGILGLYCARRRRAKRGASLIVKEQPCPMRESARLRRAALDSALFTWSRPPDGWRGRPPLNPR